jgi:hypothetical protein
VNTVSNADFQVLGCISVGIHLPSSITVTYQFLCIITVIFLQNQAKASSTALSTISKTM